MNEIKESIIAIRRIEKQKELLLNQHIKLVERELIKNYIGMAFVAFVMAVSFVGFFYYGH